jgi:hypothetical protein
VEIMVGDSKDESTTRSIDLLPGAPFLFCDLVRDRMSFVCEILPSLKKRGWSN